MLRSFTGRFLLAAKTAVKEPVKQRVVKKKDKTKAKKVIDPTKFQHSTWRGNSLPELISALPRPAKPNVTDSSTWLHKNGYGLKFYRELWTKFPEPSYWTIAKYKPASSTSSHPRAWGFRTWRGVTEPVPRIIPSLQKREWRILLEPGTRLGPSKDEFWEAPAITEKSAPRESTQLPDDLKGTDPKTWPYPWGKLGTRNVQPSIADAAAPKEGDAAAPATPAAQ